MTRYRNGTGQALISMEFGVIGPNELAPGHYDPAEHGVIPGCVPEEEPDAESTPGGDASADSTDPDGKQPARKRGTAATKDKEASA